MLVAHDKDTRQLWSELEEARAAAVVVALELQRAAQHVPVPVGQVQDEAAA